LSAETDEYVVKVTASFRFAAFTDRHASRRKALIYTQVVKLVPYVRRRWGIKVEFEVADPEPTGNRIPYT
jgi:hypothetical protein